MGWLICVDDGRGYDGMVDVNVHLRSSLRWSFGSSFNTNRNAMLQACPSGETFMIIRYLPLSLLAAQSCKCIKRSRRTSLFFQTPHLPYSVRSTMSPKFVAFALSIGLGL